MNCETSPVDNGEASNGDGVLDTIFHPRHHQLSPSLHEVGDNSCSDRVPASRSLTVNFLNLRHGDRWGKLPAK